MCVNMKIYRTYDMIAFKIILLIMIILFFLNTYAHTNTYDVHKMTLGKSRHKETKKMI